MSLNETGLLSKLNILAATLVHFHRFICTTIVRVRMTQIPVIELMHRTNDLGVTLAPHPLTNALQTSRRDVVGFSPHLRPVMELAKAPIVNALLAEIFL
jgi:hypothetical protein